MASSAPYVSVIKMSADVEAASVTKGEIYIQSRKYAPYNLTIVSVNGNNIAVRADSADSGFNGKACAIVITIAGIEYEIAFAV